MPRVTEVKEPDLELLETSVNAGKQSYYHITKSFNVISSRKKYHPVSEAAAFLNHVRMNKGVFWGGTALISISLSSIVIFLLI